MPVGSVPGDVVLLEAGVRVPADLALLESEDLSCDESLLTGESAPVKKAAGAKEPMVFAGTMITRGRGRGLRGRGMRGRGAPAGG